MQKYIISFVLILFSIFVEAQNSLTLKVSYDAKTSLCNSIEKISETKAVPSIETAENSFYSFFESLKHFTKVSPEKESLKIKHTNIDAQNVVHIRAQQYIGTIPVYGAEFTYHISSSKESFLGSIYPPQKGLSTLVKINENQAREQAVIKLLGNPNYVEQVGNGKQVMEVKVTQMYYYPLTNNDLVQVYEVTIDFENHEQWLVYIDAISSNIINAHRSSFNIIDRSGVADTASAYDLHGILRKINVYKERDTFYMMNIIEDMFFRDSFKGAIEVIDDKLKGVSYPDATDSNRNIVCSVDNLWVTDSCAISAAYNLSEINRFYAKLLGLNSFDNQGSTLKVFINGGDMRGNGWDNSLWAHKKYMVLGAGYKLFYNFARSKDIMAHEYGHAVVMNSTNLTYNGEPGAIHEGYADMFGYTADQQNWQIGEDAVKDRVAYPSGALRDMSNPTNGSLEGTLGWQPKHMKEEGVGNGVSSGVHKNSGIPNYMFYTYANEIGAEKALQVMYKALVDYMNKSTGFVLFRKAVLSAAANLYGEDAFEVAAADRAFAKVGIYNDSIDDGCTHIARVYNKESIILDSILLIKGVVMATDAKGCYLQDDQNPWSGIYIKDSTRKYTVQSKLKFRGILDTLESNRFFIPDWASQTSPGSSYKAIPLKIDELQSAYLNMCISLERLKCSALPNTQDIWTVEKDGKTIYVSNKIYKFTPKEGSVYTISGILTYEAGQYILLPREKNDIVNWVPNDEIKNLSSSGIYPNPTKNHISFYGENINSLSIYNIVGQEILRKEVKTTDQIDISFLKTGIYIVELRDANSAISQLKMIKQ